MKNLINVVISLSLIGLLFTGCTKDKINEVAKVKVHVNDFSISQDEFSTKDSPASYSGVKAMTLAFYDGTTEVYKTTQYKDTASTYTTFGEFDLSLPMGNYTMVVIGHGLNAGESAVTLTSPTTATFGTNPARETFAATQAVNITTTDAVELSASLDRIVSKLQMASTDARATGAASVRMTFAAGSKSFNPTTGLATDNTGFSNTVTISSAVGNTTLSNSYLFLATDEQTMDVTIDVLDVDGNTISHKVVNDVPFKRNRVTKLTGSLYSAGTGSSFQLNTSWQSAYEMSF